MYLISKQGVCVCVCVCVCARARVCVCVCGGEWILTLMGGDFWYDANTLWETPLDRLKIVCGGGGLVAKSCPTLVTPWTIAHQTPLSMGFPRQEYWSGLPSSTPGDLPDPGIKPKSTAVQVGSLPLSHQGSHKIVWITLNPLEEGLAIHSCILGHSWWLSW